MPRRLLTAFCLLLLPVLAQGQEPFPGETLISPMNAHDTQLLDMDGNVVQTWHGSERPKALAYMLDDGSIVRPCRDTGGAFNVNTAGGRIQRIDAADNIVWDYLFSTEQYQQHHDIQPMPGVNVLVIAWEKRTPAEAQALGATNVTGEIWSTLVAEIEPVGATGGNIVWEWHLWDHLVQDVDPEKPGYGVVVDHPELLNINDPNLAANGDWFHENAIDYSPELDQVVICSRKTDEFYIIDHSTTTAEAAGHSGGNAGRGGDFLYRWGNPQVYGRGSPADHHFNIIHGVNWVDAGLPGAGNLIAFSNGTDYSVVVECTPPLQGDGTYFLAPGEAYGPAEPTWTYGGPGGFYGGATHCGGVRLPNGNTLITATQTGYVFEVTAAGATVWEYDDPARIARGLRYWTDATAVTSRRDAMAVPTVVLEANHPNPFNPQTTIRYALPAAVPVHLTVFDLAGRIVKVLKGGEVEGPGQLSVPWDGTDTQGRSMSSGTYFYRLTAGPYTETRRMVLVR